MTNDKGFGADQMGVAALQPMMESGRERTTLVVRKWDDDQTNWVHNRLDIPDWEKIPEHVFKNMNVDPYEEYVYEGNLITRAGWAQLFLGGIVGITPTKFSATVGRIGIGTATTPAAAATDVALTTAGTTGSGSNWILCGNPPSVVTTATPCTVAFSSIFGVNDAVGAWNEFAIDQGVANSTPGTATTVATAPMMNHSVAIGAGTKAGGTWTATATLSFT